VDALLNMATDDAHFKMCKKIALLTKVIYHLNITNEDNDGRMAAARKRWEDDARLAAADAAARIERATAAAAAQAKEVARLEAAVAAEVAARGKDAEDARLQALARDKEFK
jgi:hypothetical protein